MKLLIAGSRGLTDFVEFDRLLEAALIDMDVIPDMVISGGARGVDALGKAWAELWGLDYWEYKADWGRFGRAAGMYRNSEMVEACDCAFVWWDGESPGTLDTLDKLRRSGKPYRIAM